MKDIIQRKLPGILKGKMKTVNLFIESVRALARNSMAAEQMYMESKDNNVHIIPADYPGLFEHHQSPTQSFVRKLICNLQELDRDTLVYRMAHGRAEKMKTTKKRTQDGRPKVSGCSSVLEQKNASEAVQKKILILGRKRSMGEFGWRPMAEKVSKLLKLDYVLSHETVRRMCEGLAAKQA